MLMCLFTVMCCHLQTPPPRNSSSSNYRAPRSRDEPRPPPSRPAPPRSGGEHFARRTLNNVFHYPSNVSIQCVVASYSENI